MLIHTESSSNPEVQQCTREIDGLKETMTRKIDNLKEEMTTLKDAILAILKEHRLCTYRTTLEENTRHLETLQNKTQQLTGAVKRDATEIKDELQEIKDDLEALKNQTNNQECSQREVTTMTCGESDGWTQVTFVDMSNSSHRCPHGLGEITLEGKRVCGRVAPLPVASCVSARFPTGGRQYSSVCGRLVGFQYGDTTAFGWYTTEKSARSFTIDTYYVDGVTLTHGQPGRREHIWTFATGLYENRPGYDVCPCAPHAHGATIPSFIGQDYFCESGIPGTFTRMLHGDDPLWDGRGCTSENTCCTFNYPPYFTKQLAIPTTDLIEMRVCDRDGYSSSSAADTFVQLIELYIK